MPAFSYQAMNAAGQELKETIEASNADEAVAKIRGKGLFLLRIREHNKPDKEPVDVDIRKEDLAKADEVFQRLKGRIIRLCQFCHEHIGITETFEFRSKGRLFACSPVERDVWHGGCFRRVVKYRRWLFWKNLVNKDFPGTIDMVGETNFMSADEIAFVSLNWEDIESSAVMAARTGVVDFEDREGDCRRRLLRAAHGLEPMTVIDKILARNA